MSKKRSTVKSDKGEGRKLTTAASLAFEAGDYLLVREINNKIIELSPGGDLAAEARVLNSRLDFDPFLGRFAAVAWGIYGLGWGVGLLS